jgi:hypothetical protein
MRARRRIFLSGSLLFRSFYFERKIPLAD